MIYDSKSYDKPYNVEPPKIENTKENKEYVSHHLKITDPNIFFVKLKINSERSLFSIRIKMSVKIVNELHSNDIC